MERRYCYSCLFLALLALVSCSHRPQDDSDPLENPPSGTIGTNLVNPKEIVASCRFDSTSSTTAEILCAAAVPDARGNLIPLTDPPPGFEFRWAAPQFSSTTPSVVSLNCVPTAASDDCQVVFSAPAEGVSVTVQLTVEATTEVGVVGTASTSTLGSAKKSKAVSGSSDASASNTSSTSNGPSTSSTSNGPSTSSTSNGPSTSSTSNGPSTSSASNGPSTSPTTSPGNEPEPDSHNVTGISDGNDGEIE